MARVGDSFKLFGSLEPSDADEQGFYFFSDNTDAAIVEDYGDTVTVVDYGQCRIYAVTDDGQFQDSLVLEIQTPFDHSDFIVPDELTTIDEEAFAGIAATSVRLNGHVTSIGNRAFADCPNLEGIYIHPSTRYIADNAFENVENLVLFGAESSYAQAWAEAHGYRFVAVQW